MLPLTGLRILAVEQYGAGPFGTQYLSDLGAEVIKIEPPDGGDVSRDVGPFFMEGANPGDTAASLFFQGLNRNKRSITLDLKNAEGQTILHELAATADAVCNNLRGDVPAKLGLAYDALKAIKPALVCAHLSAYGRDNERTAWPGYDFLMQAEAGYFAVTGEPSGPPARMGLSIIDMMAGLSMSFGLISSVMQARETGVGRDIDVNLFDTALFNLNYLAQWYLGTGHNQGREPRSAHASLVPCQLYKTSDGWIYLMCNKEKFFGILCELIDRAAWKTDARFLNFKERLANRDTLTSLIDEALANKTTTEWLAILQGKVPVAPLNDVAQALENPFVRNRGRIATATTPDGHPVDMLATPIHLPDEVYTHRAAPALGADNDAILGELGYDAACIARFRSERVI
jgi:succinate--hydroxymethylglutarate CoA-transferase